MGVVPVLPAMTCSSVDLPAVGLQAFQALRACGETRLAWLHEAVA